MSPDRGGGSVRTRTRKRSDNMEGAEIGDEMLPDMTPQEDERTEAEKVLAARAEDPTNFTIRGVCVGLVIGVIICFSNIYFGLQTGWISGMAMPAALISFGFFKALSPFLKTQFSPVENVLVQSVAGSVGTMPLGCGFVGVIPALEFLLKPDEGGPLQFPLKKLILFAVGISLFGVVFAVPLRKQVILKEKLKFPSGSATAMMIGVLHGDKEESQIVEQPQEGERDTTGDNRGGNEAEQRRSGGYQEHSASQAELLEVNPNPARGGSIDWRAKIKLLIFAFIGSAIYTIMTYFIPVLHSLPILGLPLANKWLWTFNPSPAYIGQGIIMGPATTLHMFLGAILGWGVLSPLAKHQGWASGPVSDWETGSKGWIVWVSLAIMLADAIVSLGWLVLEPLMNITRRHGPEVVTYVRHAEWRPLVDKLNPKSSNQRNGYKALRTQEEDEYNDSDRQHTNQKATPKSPNEEIDAPPQHLIGPRQLLTWAAISLIFYFTSVHLTFPKAITPSSSVIALLLSLLLSIMGVRAIGTTDLNPVSGISKLTQLIFSAIIPLSSNPNAITINLIAGAISESGALQAGDLMQDLKTGHLLGAAPNAQFYGQVIGSIVGSIVAAGVYRLYTKVYEIPGGMFQMPTAFVWIFTARLVTGKGLPEKAPEASFVAAALFAALTALRIYAQAKGWKMRVRGLGEVEVQSWIPGGIAVAVGMYNTPSFTLARTIGGLITGWWVRWKGKGESGVVVLASGLILGEGVFSIANLAMESLGVPHL